MPNAHSHAFQRSFAGLSEFRTSNHDSFWTWRELMYRHLQSLSPDECYIIARQLYSQMLRSGYTSVGEFHYVHNRPDGSSYSDIAAMSHAVIRAATDAGISVCFLPVLYQRGGFDNRPPNEAQRRFCLDSDVFLELCESLDTIWNGHPLVTLGAAFHSLRAVDVNEIARVGEQITRRHPIWPIHIHVAEQTAEVEECLSSTHRRPVELLLERCAVDSRWCLIHATHLTELECEMLTRSQAVVCVCPTTEANLGDGIFSAERFLTSGGRLAIGSDSQIEVDPFAELRLLEYGQRLTQRRRAVLCDQQQSCGEYLYRRAATGGAQALGLPTGQLSRCQRADLIVVEADSAPIQHLFDRLAFAQPHPAISRVMVLGRWAV
jgi:formimidoylglutamate deiminase